MLNGMRSYLVVKSVRNMFDAQADNMFAEIDTDGDGFLSRAEVTEYIKRQGGTEDEANEEVDELDTNKDGKLSKEEFRAAFG